MTLAVQNDEIFVEIDPYLTSYQASRACPQALAEKYHVFPLRIEGDNIVMAADNLDMEGRKKNWKMRLA